MSRSLNLTLLIGNLGAAPVVRTTTTGKTVAEISVATERTWLDSQNVQQSKTQWHRIILWAALAEFARDYLRKGSRVFVQGDIEYRSYVDKEGVTKYVTEITAQQLIGLDATPPRARVETPVVDAAAQTTLTPELLAAFTQALAMQTAVAAVADDASTLAQGEMLDAEPAMAAAGTDLPPAPPSAAAPTTRVRARAGAR